MEQLNVQPYLWEITVDPRLGLGERGLGMMTTVTLPVYNRTQESMNQTILGVMGIDVPTSDLGKRTPFMKIGTNGYSFAINPNGYAVFHPNLKRTGPYMKDPPNIDLLELELQPGLSDGALLEREDSPLMKLRNHMINGDTSKLTIHDTLFLAPDKKYVSWATANYAFTNITNTTFRLGLSVPEFQKNYPHFRDTTVPDFKPTMRKLQGEMRSAYRLAPWDYLGTGTVDQDFNSTLYNLLEVLSSGSGVTKNLTEDDIQLLQQLAADIEVATSHDEFFYTVLAGNDTQETIRIVNEEFQIDLSPILDLLEDIQLEPDFVSFVASNAGLTMVYPASEAGLFEDDLDVRNSSYYQRAIYSPGYVFIPIPDAENSSLADMMIVRAVSVHSKDYRTAVVGVRLNADKIRDIMIQSVETSSKQTNSEQWAQCADEDSLYCYLLDDGGFLVASNQEEDQIGTFLGELDPQLWNEIQNETISFFGRTVQYDFQAMCKGEEETSSAGARSVLVPSVTALYEALTVNWWTGKVAWAFTSFNVYNWLFGPGGVFGQEDAGEEVPYTVEESGVEEEEEECVMAYQQFHFNKQNRHVDPPRPIPNHLQLTVQCPACTREVKMAKLHLYTNLVLVVAEKKCEACGDKDKPVSQQPYRISQDEERALICSLSQHPRPRVVSYGCYDNDPNEDESKCGAESLPRGRLMPVLASLVTVFTVWMLSQHHR